MEGIAFGESPRWHDGRLWFSDWGAHQVIALDPDGGHEVVVKVPSVVAESHGNRLTAYDIGQDGGLGNRRVWADTGDDHPDGICVDAEGAIWYADVANRHCVRVREGGEVLATAELDRGAFGCALSRGDQPQLYVVGQAYGGPQAAEPTGQVVVFPAPAPAAGKP